MSRWTVIAACLVLATAPMQAHAQDGAFVNPCARTPATDFDFWVGEWVAFDETTGVVQGIDRISRVNNGCVIAQDWTQMTDRFRPPGADFRYAGVSYSSVLNDGRWQQVWVGNWGGTFTLRGGLNDDGVMVLQTDPAQGRNQAGQTVTFQQTWYWAPQTDSSVRSWGEVRTRNEDGSWSEPQVPWALRYVARANSPDLVAAPQEGN